MYISSSTQLYLLQVHPPLGQFWKIIGEGIYAKRILILQLKMFSLQKIVKGILCNKVFFAMQVVVNVFQIQTHEHNTF